MSEQLRGVIVSHAAVAPALVSAVAADAIHPFADGNGRAARAVASIPLYRSVGVPLVVTPRSRRAYLNSLEIYDREGPGTLVDFVFHRDQSPDEAARRAVDAGGKAIRIPPA